MGSQMSHIGSGDGGGGLTATPTAGLRPALSYSLSGWTERQVVFEVENNWTRILHADPYMLHLFDRRARYPTPMAEALGSGFVPPGDANGWDGWIRLIRFTKTSPPRFPTGLLPMLSGLCTEFGFQAVIRDQRKRPEGDIPESACIELRDYQQAAVAEAVRVGRGVLDMPPRSGKTRTMAEIHRQIALPTLWVAPTDRIVSQTHEVLEGFFGKNYAEHLVGSRNWEKAFRKKVVLCTAATAGGLPAEFFKTRQMIVIDEWHHGAAKTYRDIFDNCDHVFFRYGMTGTFFRSGLDEMAMRALLSNVLYKITSLELLARGYLVPTHVVFIPVAGRVTNAEGGYHIGHGRKGIHEHLYRQTLVAHVSRYLQATGRRVLVLVGTKAQGRDLKKLTQELVPQAPERARFKSVELLTSETPRPIQKEILESFTAGQEVKVLIGTSLVGEGVDLPNTDALVYARGEKAEVTLTQNAFRVCTSAPGKAAAIIVDFADRQHRKLLEHAKQRLAIYHSEPIFKVEVLQDPNDFPAWLKKVCG